MPFRDDHKGEQFARLVKRGEMDTEIPQEHGVDCPDKGGCRFRVWAPLVDEVQLRLLDRSDGLVPMEARDTGYFEANVTDAGPGTRYRYQVGGRDLPGSRVPLPAGRRARTVPGGGRPVSTGTMRPGGAAARSSTSSTNCTSAPSPPRALSTRSFPHLPYLKDLGVTAVELMPVAQFPGERNWGYDGVFPFAAQNSYGGPEGLKRLVDACHRAGPRGGARRGVQPPRARRQLPSRLSLRTSPTKYRTPWGRRSISTGPAATRCGVLRRECALLDQRVPHRRAAAGRGSRHPRRVRLPVPRRTGRGRASRRASG